MTTIADPLSKEVSFPDEHVGQVEVFALDREDNIVTRWKLYDAFPRLMNILPMGQSAEGIVRVNVTFAFRRWSSRGVEAGDSERLFGILNFRKNSLKNAIKSKIAHNINDWIDSKDLRRIDRFIAYGLIAAQMAIEDSKWVPSNLDENEKTGVLVGSGIGGLETIANTTEILNTKGARKISPFFIPSALINLISGQVNEQLS